MHKRFELWLDESGDFFREKEKRSENKLPSLVGGLLVPVEKVPIILNTTLLDDLKNHANCLSDADKREYVLPILQKLVQEHGLCQVFFENSKYEDAPSNRHLYLRLMAEGILQLMQKLDGLYESVELCVWIAQRQDTHSANPDKKRIDEAEYLNMLQRVMEQRRKERSILLNENSRVHFVIRPAHQELRIQLADFACNTRLTRFSEAFDTVRSEVEKLYDTAHIFDLHESKSENYIKICMEKGDVADAVMELFTTWEPLDRAKQLNYVLAAMQNNSREQNEVLLKQCYIEIETYLYAQEDYQMGERFLEKIQEELIPKLIQYQLPYKGFAFKVQLFRMDLYLKLGNTVKARKALEACRENLQGSLEQIYDIWQLLSKEAQLNFDEGKQEKAEEILAGVCESQRNLKEFWGRDKLLDGFDLERRTEGYGNALCHYIYVLLPRQQEPGMYQKLCDLLEEAMAQFGKDCGKRELLCRYRSLLEARQGHIEEALKWLFGVDCVEENSPFRQWCEKYLQQLQLRKDSRDIRFGVMYYLIIMNEADKEGRSFAKTMAGVFGEQYALLEYLGLRRVSVSLPNEVDMTEVSQEESQNKGYHPTEQIYMYYADYLARQERNVEALTWYRKAVEVCFANPEYLTMNLAGLKIVPHMLQCLVKMGNRKAADYERNKALEQVEILLQQNPENETKTLIREIGAF